MIGNWARNGAHVFGWAFPSRCFAKKILALSAWPLMAARGILLKRGMRTPTSQDPVQNLSSKRLQKTPRGPYKGCRCFLFFYCYVVFFVFQSGALFLAICIYLLHFGAKTFTLLNFGAKICHLYCSSIFPRCSLIYPKCSSIFP